MMDIYNQRSRWKIYLGLAGICILFISLYYTNYLAQRLREGERNKASLLFYAYDAINQANDPQAQDLEVDLSLPLSIIESNKDIPIMWVDQNNTVLYGRNFGLGLDSNEVFLQQRLIHLQKKGPKPIEISGEKQFLYYQNSRVLELLTYFPYLQLLLLAAFIFVGYISINNARRAEQNRVWVGMAKETAHQLGTPISAIIGWIEHLRESHYRRPDELEVLDEMQNDVARLDLIADRFSKIGSAPALDPVNVYSQMREITNYIRRRASRKIVFEEPPENSTPLMININPPLFNWVIENIMRNALDAMEEGTGTIKWEVHDHAHDIEINISDTGKGIPPSKLKTIFEPGFTTKARGWGLGLSLAQRIIENYHKGRIHVKHSKLGEGTMFAIHLPKRHLA
ncbi:MAG: ATP-binding protein [Saprospiraceae bacterium]